MIDLEYFTEELKTDGFEVAVFIDTNETFDHRFRSHNHDHKYKSDKGFHIDGSIHGSIATYTQNCGLSNILVKLLPFPQPLLRARTDAQTNPSAQRATQIRSVLARVYAVARQNQITTTVP
jgi:hypothetical protein